MSERFILTIPNWTSISLSVYEKTYSETKNRFEDTLDESQTITKRAIAVFTFVLAVSGFMISKNEGNVIDYLISITLFIMFVLSILLMMPKGVLRRGTAVKTIITDDLISQQNEEMQNRVFYYLQLQTYYERTERMKLLNNSRIKLLFWEGVGLMLLILLLVIKFS